MSEYLTTGDLAKLGGVVPATARGWIDRGMVPHVRTRLGVRLVKGVDAEAFLKKRAATVEPRVGELRTGVDLFAQLDDAIAAAAPSERPGLVVALAARLAMLGAGLSTLATSNPAPDENLDVETGARRLGMSPRYIYKHPELPFVLRIGRRLLLSSRGIDKYIAQRAGKA